MIKWKCFTGAILLAILTGCSDFLEEQSQDEVRPSTTLEIQYLLNYEGYPSNEDNTYGYIDLLTDDSECFGPQGITQEYYLKFLDKFKDFYTWSNDMFQELSDSRFYNSWEILYKRILGCNVTLDYIYKVDGKMSEKMNIQGQAYGLRAYYYLILVNLYAQPYNSPLEKPEVSKGVPIMLSLNFSDVLPERNTVKEVYDQIESDLTNALKSFEASGTENEVTQMSANAVLALMSRVYLYKEDWDKVIACSEELFKKQSRLTALNTADDKNVFSLESEELIWHITGYDLSKFYNGYPGRTTRGFFSVSDNLVNLYQPTPEGLTDLRLQKYFEQLTIKGGGKVPIFGSKSFLKRDYRLNSTSDGIRLSEIYLNRAEAYIQKYLTDGNTSWCQKALDDLNYLRINRYYSETAAYTPVEYTDGNKLLNFYKQERRKELCFEGLHRWCDLRRWGMPSITHTYISRNDVSETVTLKEQDLRYVILIPETVRKRNFLLEQNPR